MGMQVGGQIWHPALGLKSLGSKFSLIREGRVSVGVCRMGLSPGILHQPWAFRPQEVWKRPRRSTSLQGRKRRSVKGQLGSLPRRLPLWPGSWVTQTNQCQDGVPLDLRSISASQTQRAAKWAGRTAESQGSRENSAQVTLVTDLSTNVPQMWESNTTHTQEPAETQESSSVPGLKVTYASMVPSGTGGIWWKLGRKDKRVSHPKKRMFLKRPLQGLDCILFFFFFCYAVGVRLGAGKESCVSYREEWSSRFLAYLNQVWINRWFQFRCYENTS